MKTKAHAAFSSAVKAGRPRSGLTRNQHRSEHIQDRVQRIAADMAVLSIGQKSLEVLSGTGGGREGEADATSAGDIKQGYHDDKTKTLTGNMEKVIIFDHQSSLP
jgi:hypothetical protein